MTIDHPCLNINLMILVWFQNKKIEIVINYIIQLINLTIILDFSAFWFAAVEETSPLEIKRAGTLGKSITLPCNLPKSKPPNVQWEDTVHTSTADPIVIYRSTSASEPMNKDHANIENMEVNDFKLTINNLSFDDSGEYMCVSTVGSETHKITYNILIHSEFYLWF